MAAVIFGLPPAFFLPPLAFGVANACATKIVQGWPKLWADFRALTGIFSQSVGPSLAIWANPVQFSFQRVSTDGRLEARSGAAHRDIQLEALRAALQVPADALQRLARHRGVHPVLPGPETAEKGG